MLSQRLRTMMDPRGHVATRRASAAVTAVVWATNPRTRSWIVGEIVVAGVEPLCATAFRHVDASLRNDAGPPCALAVLDWNAISAAHVATLTTARWTGYRGAIIAVAEPGVVSPQIQAIVCIDAIVSPERGAGLREAVARLATADQR